MAKQIPLRQCVGCREMKPKTELVRVIKTPEDEICLDKTGRKNGRGAYICLNQACLESGGFLTEKAIQEGVAYFVIIAEDASGNTQKKFMDKCKYYEIPYTIAFDSTTLGRQIGKQERTVLAVTDAGLAKQISDKLD